MPIYPGSTTNINLYPTTPTELNIALYPPAESGGIALVQSASGTTDDGSLGLPVPFGAAVVSGAGTSAADGTYTFVGYENAHPIFCKTGTNPLVSAISWNGIDSWNLYSTGGAILYQNSNADPLPWQNIWGIGDAGEGDSPAPTVTCSSPVTAGNSVLMFNSRDSGAVADSTMVSGGGETLGQEAFSDDTPRCGVFGAFDLTGGETGVVSTGGALRFNNTIIEVSGLTDAAATDTDTNTGTGTLASLTGLTGTGACFAIFAVENATNPFVGLASNVNVTGIGAGLYEPRGEVDLGDGVFTFYNLAGQPTTDPNVSPQFCLFQNGSNAWQIVDGSGTPINTSTDMEEPPYEASWTGSVVTESPSDWTLVTIPPVGGSNVWQCVAWKDGEASPVSVELTGSLNWAAVGAVFEAA